MADISHGLIPIPMLKHYKYSFCSKAQTVQVLQI